MTFSEVINELILNELQKASVRATLNDARDEYQNAVDYRDSLERKCVAANKEQ